jgi:hypothetical protein
MRKSIIFLMVFLLSCIVSVHALTITNPIVQGSGVDLHRNISVLSNLPTSAYLENLPHCALSPNSLSGAGVYSVSCNEPAPVAGHLIINEKGASGTVSVISQMRVPFLLNGGTPTPTTTPTTVKTTIPTLTTVPTSNPTTIPTIRTTVPTTQPTITPTPTRTPWKLPIPSAPIPVWIIIAGIGCAIMIWRKK